MLELVVVVVVLSSELFCLGWFFKKWVKTAVLEDGNRPAALVWIKLIEWYRFGVGDEKSFFLLLTVVVGKD